MIVYVREAHPTDGWQVRANERDNVLVATHKTLAEREEAAMHCAKDLGLNIPVVMDGMDDAIEKAYQGWPDRLYVVGKDGLVKYAGDKGPWGFKPEEAKTALRELIN